MMSEKGKPLIAFITPYSNSILIDRIIKGIHDYCMEQDLQFVILNSFNSVLAETKAITTVNNMHADGIILMPLDSGSYSDGLLKLVLNKKKIVFVDRKLPGLPIPCVSSDHFQITYQAVKYLHKKGHKKIAFISPTKNLPLVHKE